MLVISIRPLHISNNSAQFVVFSILKFEILLRYYVVLTGQALKEEALFTSKSGKTALNILIFKQLLFHNSFHVQTRPNTGKDDI